MLRHPHLPGKHAAAFSEPCPLSAVATLAPIVLPRYRCRPPPTDKLMARKTTASFHFQQLMRQVKRRRSKHFAVSRSSGGVVPRDPVVGDCYSAKRSQDSEQRCHVYSARDPVS